MSASEVSTATGTSGLGSVAIAAVIFLITRGRELMRRRTDATQKAAGYRNSRSNDG